MEWNDHSRRCVIAAVRPLTLMARMGYDLHITRRDFWADEGDGVPITLDDWKRYIAKVQGDEGETYAEDGTIVNTDGSSVHSPSCAHDGQQKPTKPWWKFW